MRNSAQTLQLPDTFEELAGTLADSAVRTSGLEIRPDRRRVTDRPFRRQSEVIGDACGIGGSWSATSRLAKVSALTQSKVTTTRAPPAAERPISTCPLCKLTAC